MRIIFIMKNIRYDNTAPVSNAESGILTQGPFFILYKCRMTQEYDTTTELCSGIQGLGGGAFQQALCKFQQICIACYYYPEERTNAAAP